MRKRIILSLITLILGIVIYYLYYKKIIDVSTELLRFVRNFIPDFLWMFSFFFLSVNYSKRITKKYIILTSTYALAMGTLFELLQMENVVKGTFDILDIIVYIISILIACIVEKLLWRDENEKNKT